MPSRDSSRRDFLTGRAVVRSAQDAVDRALDGAESTKDANRPQTGAGAGELAQTSRSRGSYLLQYATRAMACEFEVTVPADGDDQHASKETEAISAVGGTVSETYESRCAEPAALTALRFVEELEQQLTVYTSTSELSQINQRAASDAVVVEPRLFALLQQCQRLWEETDRAFDITSTPLTRVWGFFRREGKLPDDAAIDEARAQVGFQHVQLDAAEQSVRFARPGIELNLGSIGKGYALDRCGELMKARDEDCFLWHAGQSSVLASGDMPGRKAGSGWRIEIGNPLRPGKSLGTLSVRDAGVATSGSSQQFFRQCGRRYGHVIDPRTGVPTAGVLSVTVLAPTAAIADALATAFYVLGPDQATGYCRAHKDCGFVMLARNDTDGPVNLRTFGLTEDQLRLESTGIR